MTAVSSNECKTRRKTNTFKCFTAAHRNGRTLNLFIGLPLATHVLFIIINRRCSLHLTSDSNLLQLKSVHALIIKPPATRELINFVASNIIWNVIGGHPVRLQLVYIKVDNLIGCITNTTIEAFASGRAGAEWLIQSQEIKHSLTQSILPVFSSVELYYTQQVRCYFCLNGIGFEKAIRSFLVDSPAA